MKCRSCGSELDFDSAFCGDCGARVGGHPQGVTPAAAKRSPLPAIALALVVLAAAGGGWLFWKRTTSGGGGGGGATAPVLTRAATLLPADTAMMLSWRNPVHSWEQAEQSGYAQRMRETPAGRAFLEKMRTDPDLAKLREVYEAFDQNRTVFRQFDDFVSVGVVANPAHPDRPDVVALLQGGSALALAQGSGALAKAIEQGGLRTTSERIGDVDLVTAEDPKDPAGPHWFYAVTQSFLVASQERQRIVDTLNRGSVAAPILGTDPGFVRASELAPEIDEGFLYVNVAALEKTMPPMPPAEGGDESAAKHEQALRSVRDQLSGFQAVAARIAFRDGGIRTEARAYRAPNAPPLAPSGPLGGKSWALLPDDALLFQGANHATLAAIGAAATQAQNAGAAPPQQLTETARAIFAEIGDEAGIAIFEPAPDAPLPVPGVAIVLTPKDAAGLPRLEAAVESAIQGFVPTGFIGPKEDANEGGLAMSVHSAMGGVSLAYAKIGGALVIGSTKPLLKRIADVQGGHAPALAGRFAANAHLKEIFASADSVGPGYLNWRGLVDPPGRAAERPELQALLAAKAGDVDWKTQLASLRTIDFIAGRSWQQPAFGGSTIFVGLSPDALAPPASTGSAQ